MERDKLQGNSFSAGLLACLIAAASVIVSPSPVPGQTSPPAMERLPADTAATTFQEPSEQSLRAAVRGAENQYGPQSKELLKPLADLASYLTKNARYNDALEVLDRVLSIELREYGPEHPEVADTFESMAYVHFDMGAYAKAEALYKRALAIRDKVLAPDGQLVATLSHLALLYKLQKLYHQAEPLLQRKLTILEKSLGPEHPDVVPVLNELAGRYYDEGQYAKAEPLYQRSLAIAEKALGPDDPIVATRLDNLAAVYLSQGQYAKAEPLYQRSLAIAEKALGPDDPIVATRLDNLATVYDAQGQYAKAEPLYQRSLAIDEKALGPDAFKLANTLSNLGVLYAVQDQYAKGEPLIQRALAIREKWLWPNHPRVAASLSNLGVLYAVQGQYAKGEPLIQRALAIREDALGPNHPDVAVSLYSLAGLYDSTKQFEKVLPLLNRALSIASATNIPTTLWPIQNALRHTLALEGKTDLAIFFGKQAVNTIQSLRGNLSGKDREAQRAFLQDKSGVYRKLADLLIDQGRLPEAQQVMAMLKEEELYDFTIRSVTEDNRETSAGYNGIEETWHKRYQEIGSKLGSISAEYEDLSKKKDQLGLSEEETKRRKQLDSDLMVARQAFDKFLGDLFKEQASDDGNTEVNKRVVENLQARQTTLDELGHGAVILNYVMGESKLRMILTTPSVQLWRESEISSKELNRKIQEFHTLLSDPKRNPLPLAQELYKHLIAPVREDLRQAKAQTLMVSLDGAMRYIPLAALYDGEKYLIEDYRIAIYTEAATDKLTANPRKQWSVAGLGLTQKIEGFSPLPSVRQEIEGIVKSGDKGVLPGEAHFDQEFDAERFRDALDNHPVLHIASHFVFRPGNGSNSFLLLGNGKQLSLADIKRYQFKEDLITLSACETAVGGGVDANGLEIEGFGALAQKQGAKSVIATLWSVADRSTGILMQNFYRLHEQTQGITKVEALREAQLRFIRGGDDKAGSDSTERAATRPVDNSVTNSWKADPAKPYAHPYYWAPFILMGNWK